MPSVFVYRKYKGCLFPCVNNIIVLVVFAVKTIENIERIVYLLTFYFLYRIFIQCAFLEDINKNVMMRQPCFIVRGYFTFQNFRDIQRVKTIFMSTKLNMPYGSKIINHILRYITNVIMNRI